MASTNTDGHGRANGATTAQRSRPRRRAAAGSFAERPAGHLKPGNPRLAPAMDLLPQPAPIWLAALIATRCQANGNGGGHAISWKHVSGRAIYTNLGQETESIQPLDVRLAGGQTVSVTWIPGETAYTVEIQSPYDRCA